MFAAIASHTQRPCLFLSVAVLLVLSASGCSLRNGERPIRIQLGAEPVSLDPALAEDGAALRLLANTMEGLVGYDANSELSKRLAQSYSVSKDGRRYEFKLRKDARWSDGQPVTPGDFVHGFRRTLGPGTLSKLGALLTPIRNAAAFQKGSVSAEQLGVRAEDDKLILELESPAPYFIHALTLPAALPVRSDVLEKNAGTWPETAPVTGPYRIALHARDQRIVLERNPHYYKQNTAESVIELLIVADESTALHLFEKGQLDIISKLPLTELKRLKAAGHLRSFPFLATYYLAFNVLQPPFQDPKWRRAVAAAVNRQEIAAALDSGELPAYSWIPPGLEGFSPDGAPPAFTESNLKGKFRASIPAGFDSGARNSLIMEKVQQDLVEKLGIKLSLQNMDWKSHVKRLQTESTALFRFGWQAPFRDPLPHLLAFTSANPNNYTHWQSKKYDQLVARIQMLAPGEERAELIRKADSILVREDAVVIPIYYYTLHFAVAPSISGLKMNLFGAIFFDELKRKKQ